jgi:hypothetical protein
MQHGPLHGLTCCYYARKYVLIMVKPMLCVWAEYAQAKGEYHCTLGPIESWLQLESAHSIITLLLQSMDLLSGGRNPWESNNDLIGKLERECLRWEGYI